MSNWYGIIDYLYRDPVTGLAAVGESIPYRTRSEYETEIKASADIGRPIEARRLREGKDGDHKLVPRVNGHECCAHNSATGGR